MRLLICGDRNWTDCKMIRDAIEEFKPDVVVEGEARGADTLAGIIALSKGIRVIPFPADWNRHGKPAGMIRNALMLKVGKPDLVIAFHDDIEQSKGTKHMVGIARKAGVRVEVRSHPKPVE